ncbi:MAG: peptidase S41 [Acidobacteria bacterium]|nr:MAG: peptidase S41 [Acidobacteriota bacterium]
MALCVSNNDAHSAAGISAQALLSHFIMMSETETGSKATLQDIGRAGSMTPLAKFLKGAERKSCLLRHERLRIIDQALLLLEMNYVHLPLKQAMHAINPIQRLKLLKFRLETKGSEMEPVMQFHKRMLEIFASLRDVHTSYFLPTPFRDRIAFLPFLIEQYFESDGKQGRVEKFLISRILDDLLKTGAATDSSVAFFQPGVEALYWNGVPIRRVIEVNGENQAGSNPEARLARGLDNLTVRPLDTSLPPDEKWVDLTYETAAGEALTLRLEWLVYNSAHELVVRSKGKKRAAVDIKKKKINEFKKMFFAQQHPVIVGKAFQNNFYAEVRQVSGREFGYIRLFSFEVDEEVIDRFVNEVRRVITDVNFPQQGLIIDVRGNAGGRIRLGERLLQLFTPGRIKPEPFEFINSPLNLEICRRAPKDWNLARWADSIAEAVVTGATYSLGFPLQSEESCNNLGQVYYGPVILITDALSYSTTDIFAAGFQDNEVGEILGTSDNTGAGGANMWYYGDLKTALGKGARSFFKPLPRKSELQLAMRRSVRVGRRDGRPLEELGITPDHRHYMTKRDLMKRNADLVGRAARILSPQPVYSLSVTPVKGQTHVLSIKASSQVPPRDRQKKISRVDISVNGRPYKTVDAVNGAVPRTTVELETVSAAKNWLVQAFDHKNNLVATCRRARSA